MKSILFLVFLVTTSVALADSSWEYTAFPYVAKNSPFKKNEPEFLKVGKKQLRAVMSQESGTHPYWNVEQVYLSKDLKKKVFIKYNVELSSAEPLGGWVKLKVGHVLHLKKGKDIVALMAQGFNNIELYELQKQFRSLKPSQNAWLNPFMNCASAEVVSDAMGNVHYNTEAQTPSESADPSYAQRVANVAQCVGGETLTKAMDTGKKMWESATIENAWEAVPTGEEVKAGLGKAWEAVPSKAELKAGTVALGAGIKNATVGTGRFLKNVVMDREEAWKTVTGGFDASMQLLTSVYQEVEKVVVGFADLTAEVADYLVCQIASFLIQEGAMSTAMATLTAGAGLGIAVAKLSGSILRFAGKLRPLMPAFKALSESKLTSAEKLEKAAKIMKGELKEGDLTISNVAKTDKDVATKIADIRNMSASEKETMLRASSALDDSGRISAAGRELGRDLSPVEQKALLEAHNVAADKGFNTYSAADLRAKKDLLQKAGFSDQEANLLMRKGLAGQYQPTVSATVNFRAPGLGKNSSGVAPTNSFARSQNPSVTLLKADKPQDFAEAREFFTERGEAAMRNQRVSYARSDFLQAGNSEAYVNTYLRELPDGGYKMTNIKEAQAAIATLKKEINTVSITDAGRVNIPTSGLTTEQFVKGEAMYSQQYVEHFQSVRKQAIRDLQSWIEAAD